MFISWLVSLQFGVGQVIVSSSELYSGNKNFSTDDPDVVNTNESGVTERRQYE